ncbi:hypothetical protein V8E51_013150 [Hyaloscypha variabilis]
MTAQLSSTTSFASTSSTLTSSSVSASATCDTDSITDISNFVPASILKEGTVCAFPLPVHLNFTSCCAANQTTYYTDTCIQYCVINQDTTPIDFSTCVTTIAKTQNLSIGISGCKANSAGTVKVGWWKASMLLVGVGMVLFVI